MSDLFGNEKVLALSWKEPYGSLMLHGKIETRTWKTDYRGLVLICCSQKAYTGIQVANISGSFLMVKINLKLFSQVAPDTREMDGWVGNSGMAIAVGNLVDCRGMTPNDEQSTFVHWYNDLYCHIYKNVRPIKPFPWKGSQGWKTVSPEIIKQIEFITP